MFPENVVKTVVYQSYRTFDVPSWLKCCTETVKAWANLQGFNYHFIDDLLFSYVPDWYRKKVNDNVLLMSDIARLAVAKELLILGYDRVIWVDADVLVFEPEQFQIDVIEEYAFCREIWMAFGNQGQILQWQRVNNAVSVFIKDNSFLDFYIHACQSLVRHKNHIDQLDVGTSFLTQIYELIHFRLIENVGLFSPILMLDIAQCNDACLPAYMRAFNSPIYAVNLCSSFRNNFCQNVFMDDHLYAAVVNQLLQTKGEIVNKYYKNT